MQAYLWTNLVLGIIGILANCVLIGVGKRTTTEPGERVWQLMGGVGFLVWCACLLFGAAQ